MRRLILLDAGPLGMVSHPRKNPEIKHWLQQLLLVGVRVAVPEIADYEVRRELLRANQMTGVKRLDTLKASLDYLPITTPVMLRAAEFWATLRRQGTPTAADTALDGDVILAAIAALRLAYGDDVIIATTNLRHLARLAPASLWHEIEVDL